MSDNNPTFHTESGSAAFDMDIPEQTPSSNKPDMFRDIPDKGQEASSASDKPNQTKTSPVKNEVNVEEGLSEEELPQATEEKQEETLEKSEKEQVKPKVKTIKLLDLDGKTIDISPDVKLDVIIDGKKVKASLNDLKSNYSGKVVYEKKYQELDSEKKTFLRSKNEWQTKVDSLNNWINEFYKLATEQKDPIRAMQYLISRSGLNQKDFFSTLRQKMYADAYDYFSKDEATRKQLDADEDLKYRRAEAEFLEQRIKDENDRLKHNQEKIHYMQQTGMSEDQYDEIRNQFLEKDVDPKEVTPELVAKTHLKGMVFREIGQILDRVDAKLKENQEIVEDLYRYRLDNPSFSSDDLYEVVKDAYGRTRAKNISKKVTQSAVPAVTTLKNSTAKKQKLTREDLFF